MLVSSLAGTGKKYLAAQMRERAGMVHVQVKLDNPINRTYGWTFDLPLEGFTPITALKVAGTPTVPSLAGTSQQYVPVQFRPTSGGKLHVQAASGVALAPSEYRRSYGVATDLTASTEVLAKAAMIILA